MEKKRFANTLKISNFHLTVKFVSFKFCDEYRILSKLKLNDAQNLNVVPQYSPHFKLIYFILFPLILFFST